MIEIRHLRYFLALAEHLHFAKAAASVNVTQPSLSRQIAALEDELGCIVVERNSRSVALTAAGIELQRNTYKLMQLLDSTIRTTQAVARGRRGELRVAFTSMIAWTSFPNLVKRYATDYPAVTLNLTERLPSDLVRSVEASESDLCLAFRPEVEAPLRYQSLHPEKLCIALPADHRLVGKANITVKDLRDEAFILTPREVAPALHDMIMSLCGMSGFDPLIRMHTHLQGTIVNLVAEGLGVSIVPEAMAKSGNSKITFIPIPDSPSLDLGIIWNENNQNPCLPGFLEVAKVSGK